MVFKLPTFLSGCLAILSRFGCSSLAGISIEPFIVLALSFGGQDLLFLNFE